MKFKTLEYIHALLMKEAAKLEADSENESRKLKELRGRLYEREDEPESEAVFNQEKRVNRAGKAWRHCKVALEDFEVHDWK